MKIVIAYGVRRSRHVQESKIRGLTLNKLRSFKVIGTYRVILQRKDKRDLVIGYLSSNRSSLKIKKTLENTIRIGTNFYLKKSVLRKTSRKWKSKK